ncbi:MAG: L-threonylcarbamoyladenylate synthase [Bacteroidales bacterium]
MSEDINKAVAVLRAGGVILYPSDTVWGLGCDATNFKAAQKVYKIKGRTIAASFIVLLDAVEKITEYVKEVPDILWDLVDSFDFPTTIIYPHAKKLAKNVIAHDGTIAIRIVKDGFCHEMIKAFGKPVVSTSANFTGERAPVLFREISPLLIQKVDYTVITGRSVLARAKPSTIIRLKSSGEFDIIRD